MEAIDNTGNYRQHRFCIDNRFIIRSPFFPVSELDSVLESRPSKKTIAGWWSEPVFKRAVQYASPHLTKEIERCLTTRNMKKLPKIWFALLKYRIRMCSRATPFGNFAGPSLGTFATKTRLKRIVGYDFHDHTIIHSVVEKKETVWKNFDKRRIWFVNPTLFETKGRYRFYDFGNGEKNEVSIVHEVAKTETLGILVKMMDGSGAKGGFLLHVLENMGHSTENAELYLGQLVENKLLVPNTLPSIFHSAQIQLGDNDFHTIKVQTNMYPSFHSSTLDRSYKDQLQRAYELCSLFSYNRTNTDYQEFSKAFLHLYGNKKVRLVDAMDPEYGLGYPIGCYRARGSYLDQFGLEPKRHESEKPTSPARQWLQDKVVPKDNPKDIHLHWDGLDQFERPELGFGPTFFGVVEWVKIDDKSYCHPLSFGGSSAAVLHARHAMGKKDFMEWARSITDHENNFDTDVLTTEVAYLPEGKAKHIAMRPLLRDQVLHIKNGPRNNRVDNIPTHSLCLQHDGDQLKLIDKRTDKRIKPYLTTSYDHYRSSSAIYRLLGDHQYQGRPAYVHFDWDVLEGEVSIMPRVICGDILLSKRTWRFKYNAFDMAKKAASDNTTFCKIWPEFIQSYGLPERIIWEEGDKSLVLNTRNLECMRLFVLSLGKATIVFKEYIPPGQPLVNDIGHQPYSCEFQFSFFQKPSK
ncbi:lantibiotic dehydratase [Flagellimonas pacifica]|uniref:Lantibiotic dehydratase, C terminus n=1 Tax=Flagellimonas pacifica TaxID=1247520 RepID=A0A285MSM2_9FLAO|nr:lantibiotic dehydratase [Allomuricauda parva]SNY99527.1 Lantibiotic dehydratase, C terminus [Allomuricauda parva]